MNYFQLSCWKVISGKIRFKWAPSIRQKYRGSVKPYYLNIFWDSEL